MNGDPSKRVEQDAYVADVFDANVSQYEDQSCQAPAAVPEEDGVTVATPDGAPSSASGSVPEASMTNMAATASAPSPAADADERSLNSGELAYAHDIFQDSLDYGAITITKGKLVSKGATRTVGNTINFEDDEFTPGTFDLTPSGKDTLVHEMTHVWQYQHGGWTYAPAALWAQLKSFVTTGDRDGAYDWRTLDKNGTDWTDWNPEAQAEAVEDYNKALRSVQSGSGTSQNYGDLAKLKKYIDLMQKGPAKTGDAGGADGSSGVGAGSYADPLDGGAPPGGAPAGAEPASTSAPDAASPAPPAAGPAPQAAPEADAGIGPAEPKLVAGDVVIAGGKTYIVYDDEIRQGGSCAWIARNPGNIRNGDKLGAITGKQHVCGKSGKFAIFPDEATGFSAISSVLKGYGHISIAKAMQRYAPSGDGANDPDAYARTVAKRMGVTVETTVDTLDSGQLQKFAEAIRNVEGWIPGKSFKRDDTSLPPEITSRL